MFCAVRRRQPALRLAGARSVSVLKQLRNWVREQTFSPLDNLRNLDAPYVRSLLTFDCKAEELERWELASDTLHYGSSRSTLVGTADRTALWSGSTSLEISLPPGPEGAMAAHAQRGTRGKDPTKTGWCAIRTSVAEEYWDLSEFDGVCLRVRPDRRRYMFNIRTAGPLDDNRKEDLYQAPLPRFPPSEHAAQIQRETPWAHGVLPDDDGWIKYRIPWGAFMLTYRGYVQPQPQAMHLAKMSHFGLLIADGLADDFAMELGEIKAFRYHGSEHNVPHVRAGLQLNEERNYYEHSEL